jgi:hypothetical protein
MEEPAGDRPLETAVPIAGSTALVVGSYLPWLRVNPNNPYDYVHMVHIAGMDAGFQPIPLLGAAGLVSLTALATRRLALRAASVLVAGGVTAFLCVGYLGSPDDTVGFGTPMSTGTCPPSEGPLLLIVGGVYLFAVVRAQESPPQSLLKAL